MINFNTTTAADRFPIWELTTPDIPFDRDYFEKNDIWKNNKLVDGEYVAFGDERKDYIPDSLPEFESWFNKFKKESDILNSIGSLLDLKENNEFFYTQYPIQDKGHLPSEFIKKRCSIAFNIMKDEPGYKMHNHFDNRAVFGNIFLNLTDNIDVSTTFVNTFTNYNQSVIDKDTNIHYKAPDKKNEGMFFMNTSDTYHGIHNSTDKIRYILNVLIYFSELTYV